MGKRIRLTEAQTYVLEMAKRHRLIGLRRKEKRTAFILSQKGLLYAYQGMEDYAITTEGRMALAENRK